MDNPIFIDDENIPLVHDEDINYDDCDRLEKEPQFSSFTTVINGFL